MSEEIKIPEDALKQWQLIALTLGWNELVKQAKSLGEKAFFRLCRESVEKELVAAGVQAMKQEDQTVLVLPEGPPWVRFTSTDIDLMRAAIEEWEQQEFNYAKEHAEESGSRGNP